MHRTRLMASALALAVIMAIGISAQPAAAQTRSAKKATPTTAVNLNVATATDLETLPGVGPSMAAKIVEYRQKNGAFKKIEDLMNVKGIGEKKFLKLKPLVTIAVPAPSKTAER